MRGVGSTVGRLLIVATLLATCTAPASTRPAASSSVSASELVHRGDLTVCTDAPAAPYEYYDDNGNLIGLEIDLAKEIGRRIGLNPVFLNSVFDTIIVAVNTGKCDVVMAGLSITNSRLEQIDMVPYFFNSEAFLTQKGNPSRLGDPAADPLVLCGKRAVVNTGSSEDTYMAEYDQQCKAAGRTPITIIKVAKVPDALLQISTNHADVYHIGVAAVGYYTKAQPNTFELVGGSTHPTARGIGMPKASNTLEKAIVDALRALQADGTYEKILDTYGLPKQTPPKL
jgi:polar amino acid transport system substrate-binding protein